MRAILTHLKPAIFKIYDGMSSEELLDFVLRIFMRIWISYASAGARNYEFFEFLSLKKMSPSDRGWPYFCR